MPKVMKKITAGNPLINYELIDDYNEYESCKTDEQLKDFFHKMLEKYEHRPMILRWIYAMISFSVGYDVDKKVNDLLWN